MLKFSVRNNEHLKSSIINVSEVHLRKKKTDTETKHMISLITIHSFHI